MLRLGFSSGPCLKPLSESSPGSLGGVTQVFRCCFRFFFPSCLFPCHVKLPSRSIPFQDLSEERIECSLNILLSSPFDRRSERLHNLLPYVFPMTVTSVRPVCDRTPSIPLRSLGQAPASCASPFPAPPSFSHFLSVATMTRPSPFLSFSVLRPHAQRTPMKFF